MLKKFFKSDFVWYGVYFALPCMIAQLCEQVHTNCGIIFSLFYIFCERRNK